MAYSKTFSDGPRLIDGFDLNLAISKGHRSFGDNSITALAGGGITGAPLLTDGYMTIATVATAADSVLLPLAEGGASRFVRNAGANAAQVFAAGGSTINGTAGTTGISVAAGKSVLFFSPAPGVWFSLLSA